MRQFRVWDNCAMILSERTDEELSPYLLQLMEWLIYVKGKRAKSKLFEDEVWLSNVLEIQG